MKYTPTSAPGVTSGSSLSSIPSMFGKPGVNGSQTDNPFELIAPTSPEQGASSDLNNTIQWVQQNLNLIARALKEFDVVRYKVQYVAPAKPRSGDLAYADGTHWNPGSGEGFYRYTLAGTWVIL